MRAADLLENVACWRVREPRIVGEQRGGETTSTAMLVLERLHDNTVSAWQFRSC